MPLSARGELAIPGTPPSERPDESSDPKSGRSGEPSGALKTRVERAYQAFSMSSVGLEMGVCVLIGWGIGYFIDKEYGSAPWGTLAFLGVGVAAGFKALFRAARKAKQVSSESNE